MEKTKLKYYDFEKGLTHIWKEMFNEFSKETDIPIELEYSPIPEYENNLGKALTRENPCALIRVKQDYIFKSKLLQNCLRDLSDTNAYRHLNKKEYVVQYNGKVLGIPYIVNAFGIIYNEEITKKYFSLKTKATKYNDMKEIRSFTDLKEVVEDMQRHKEELDVKGVFASMDFAPNNGFCIKSHIPNLAYYYEYRDKNVVHDFEDFEFKYSENVKNTIDLINNNNVVTDKTEYSKKTISDTMKEIANKEAIMTYDLYHVWKKDIKNSKPLKIKAEDLKMIPPYAGVEDEENQGLAIGGRFFFSVNTNASIEEQELAMSFIDWTYESKKGKEYMAKLNYYGPYDTYSEEEIIDDPLVKELREYEKNDDLYNVFYAFIDFPLSNYSKLVGETLYDYVLGNITWDELKSLWINKWKVYKAEDKEAISFIDKYNN